MDDLAIAFVMRCDEQGLTYEQGVQAAAILADEIEIAAEDRPLAKAASDEDRSRPGLT